MTRSRTRFALSCFCALILASPSLAQEGAAGSPTYLYLDFGFAWPDGTLHLDRDRLRRDDLKGPTGTHVPVRVARFAADILEEDIDYDGDGWVDDGDAWAAAADVVAIAAEMLAPFHIEVVMAHAPDLDHVAEILASTPTNDAYMIVAGTSTASGATRNGGGKTDELGLVFSGNAIGSFNDEGDPRIDTISIARTAVHEAGHVFGLHHTGTNLVDGVWRGDFMSHFSHWGTILRFDVPTDDDLVPDEDTPTQNAYEVLARVLGLRPGAPAYVTGTGLHDEILVEGDPADPHRADVWVRAYQDPGRGELVASRWYSIDPSQGVLVDASYGDDWVVVTGVSSGVELRGGPGDDWLWGSPGVDVLDGGMGNDILAGSAGDDVYHFGGIRPVTRDDGSLHPDYFLGSDLLYDFSGIDSLDFSSFYHGVRVDLGRGDLQEMVAPHTGGPILLAAPLPGLPFAPAPEPPILSVTLGSGSAIENVVGSAWNDHLTGNDLANRLEGGDGDDRLEGGRGDDTLLGGRDGDDVCIQDFGRPAPCDDDAGSWPKR